MKTHKKETLYAVLVAISVLIMINIIIEIPKIERDLKNNLRNDMVRTISSIIDNYDYKLQAYAHKYPNETLSNLLKNDPAMRTELEADLSMLISADIKYSYVLFRDHNQKFRFMLDGASNNKSAFGMKFDIEDPAWEKAYKTKKNQLIEQKNLDLLWITYLKPVVINNEVQGIIAIDFSLNGHQHITDVIQPLHKYIWIFTVLLGLGIVVISTQLVLYYFSQKRVYIDPLTHLYNRNFFNDTIKSLDYKKYAIAMLDLDKFKIINDTYGHHTGDEVLKSVSKTLKSSIRKNDQLIRYGGEEFLLYLYMDDLDQLKVYEIVNRIRQNVETIIITIGSNTIHPTVSIGLNSFTSHFKNTHDAIAMADEMLYKAKESGRNNVTSYTPSQRL